MSWKFGSLNLLEPSGAHRACYGTPSYWWTGNWGCMFQIRRCRCVCGLVNFWYHKKTSHRTYPFGFMVHVNAIELVSRVQNRSKLLLSYYLRFLQVSNAFCSSMADLAYGLWSQSRWIGSCASGVSIPSSGTIILQWNKEIWFEAFSRYETRGVGISFAFYVEPSIE
jgi:hypothetical protein